MSQVSLFDDEPPKPQPSSKRTLARRLRDDGIKRAVEHANKVAVNWSDRAHAHLLFFLLPKSRGAEFTCEQVREYAEAHGIDKPPDKRAWGHVMKRAAREGYAVKNGKYVEATDPKVHCSPAAVWEKQ
jgi:hypothetical protein